MAVQDILNNGGSQYDLTSGQYSPSEVARAYNASQDVQNVQGLSLSPVVPTASGDEAMKIKTAKAAQAFKQGKESGGLPFSPPSNGQMLMDMLGGLLLGFASAKLLGGSSKEGLAIGLLAAGGNHDADKAEQQRFLAIKDMVAKGGNYSADALFNYMKTGDDKALQETRKENHESDLETQRENNQLKLEGQREASQEKLEAMREANQAKLEGMREGAANARAARSEANALAVARINHPEAVGAVGGSAGFHLADGTPVQVIGKPMKEGSTLKLHVQLPDGSEQIVSADALQGTPTPTQSNQHKTLDANIDSILNADNSNLSGFANITGGTNSAGIGSEFITRYGNPAERQLYEKANQIEGNRLLQNVASAKAAGASGINTKQELDAYNQNLPEIDFSSPEALKDSLRKYKAYIDGGYMATSEYQAAKAQDKTASSKSDSGTVSFNDLK